MYLKKASLRFILKKSRRFPEQGKIHHYNKIEFGSLIEYLSGPRFVDF